MQIFFMVNSVIFWHISPYLTAFLAGIISCGNFRNTIQWANNIAGKLYHYIVISWLVYEEMLFLKTVNSEIAMKWKEFSQF